MALTKAQLYISSLFSSEERADCDVRFYASGPDPAAEEAAPVRTWLCDALPAHTVVLVPSSARLKAQLDNAGWQQQQQDGEEDGGQDEPAAKRARTGPAGGSGTGSSGRGRGRPLLTVPLEGEQELAPALEVLEHSYTGRLRSAGVLQLLGVFKLAAYLLADDCKEACCAALLALAKPAAPPLAAAEALLVLTRPDLAFARLDGTLQPVVAKCWAAALHAYGAGALADDDRSSLLDALQARLGDTLSVARSEELLALWAALPVQAVEALLAAESDARLPVDCEETVVFLLHKWTLKQEVQPMPLLLAFRLRSLVRPLSLGPLYLVRVLPKLQWFGLTAPAAAADLVYAALSADQLAGASAATFKQQLARATPVFAAHPQWLEKRSSSTGSADAAAGRKSALLQWHVPRSKLEQLLVQARVTQAERYAGPDSGRSSSFAKLTCPCLQYAGGLEWALQLTVGPSSRADVVSFSKMAADNHSKQQACTSHAACRWTSRAWL